MEKTLDERVKEMVKNLDEKNRKANERRLEFLKNDIKNGMSNDKLLNEFAEEAHGVLEFLDDDSRAFDLLKNEILRRMGG